MHPDLQLDGFALLDRFGGSLLAGTGQLGGVAALLFGELLRVVQPFDLAFGALRRRRVRRQGA